METLGRLIAIFVVLAAAALVGQCMNQVTGYTPKVECVSSAPTSTDLEHRE